MTGVAYPFNISERIVYEEIYSPKRAAYYGPVFSALQEGYDEEMVKGYLNQNAEALLGELRAYPIYLDPREYDTDVHTKKQLTVDDAKARIAMYRSSFKGWSTYSVDGVFFADDGKVFEEATQVVRILFRFESSFKGLAEEAGCSDVLRTILHWTIRLGRLEEETGWAPADCKLFLRNHTSWTKKKRAFAVKHFTAIAKEAQKWIHDRALFLFGYLVRKFWQNVIDREMYEKEIWVMGLFGMNLNVIKRVEG